MRHAVARVVALATLGMGCQGMYTAKPEKLKTPVAPRLPTPPPEEAAPPVAVVTYNEEPCPLKLSAAVPTPGKKKVSTATLTAEGDEKFSRIDRAPSEREKATLLVDSFDIYRRALVDDPFNAEATLKLAIAYDKARYKACALSLLGRLAQLAENPKFAPAANRRIDQVVDTKELFSGYRAKAVEAVGR